MATIGELWRSVNDPTKTFGEVERAREELGDFLRDLLESMYLARYFPQFPAPSPSLNFEPTPTPMIEQTANQQFIMSQLVLNTLEDPSRQLSIFAYIRDNQLHIDVAKQLRTRFEQAADEMRQIVE
ncbi:MAG: hypothetical protein R3A44_36105 [Caldilineaceae bacterium]